MAQVVSHLRLVPHKALCLRLDTSTLLSANHFSGVAHRQKLKLYTTRVKEAL
jgi:hypothetical protein